MKEYVIKSEGFYICFQLKVFESDVSYSSNTILTISVISDNFSANTDMDIDIKSFVVFVDALSSLYTTLNGTAIIQEPYGEQHYIELIADRSGHINIRGKLSSNFRGGFLQELSFENCIDQTYLPEFIGNLSSFCSRYR